MSEGRVPILPEWNKNSPFYQWASNFVWRNHWRVEHVFGGDKEDLMAECALMWVQCCRAYGATINSPQQMMYLYKLWVTGQFHDYSSKDTKIRRVQQLIDHNELEDISEVNIKLRNASSDLQKVLDIFIKAPQEIMEVLKKDMKNCTTKQFFQRVTGFVGIDVDKSKQLMKELQELLS